MFNKLKQIKDLRSQAKQMQSALSEESVTIEKDGNKLTMNGNLEVTEIIINKDLSQEKLQDSLRSCANDAIKKVQKLMARKMQEMGGLPGLS